MKNFRGQKTFTWEDFQKLSRLDRLKKLETTPEEEQNDGTDE